VQPVVDNLNDDTPIQLMKKGKFRNSLAPGGQLISELPAPGGSYPYILLKAQLGLKRSEEVNGAFTLDVKSVLNENLGGIILGGTQC
jgi:hypothetical protein